MSTEIEKKELAGLICRAAGGSNDALSELGARYQPLIYATVRKYSADTMSSQDIADMREEAHIAFCNAICSYDPGEGNVEFGLYAKICISNALVSYLRSQKQRRSTAVLDGAVIGSGENDDPIEGLIEKENFERLCGTIQDSLSPYESRVWWLYISGLNAKAIAEKLGARDARSVSNAIYRIRKKLRFVLGAHG